MTLSKFFHEKNRCLWFCVDFFNLPIFGYEFYSGFFQVYDRILNEMPGLHVSTSTEGKCWETFWAPTWDISVLFSFSHFCEKFYHLIRIINAFRNNFPTALGMESRLSEVRKVRPLPPHTPPLRQLDLRWTLVSFLEENAVKVTTQLIKSSTFPHTDLESPDT